ncbi:MAG: TRAP transporter substrate-binding protein [Alphaproteobacteria bacterium]|nr:TRAP transporter substrate-binding protein [Alphaproteobacteria bacterium]
MADAIQIRMGGYGPQTTTHSRALKFIGDRLEAQFGDRVEVKYIWNIMDFGYRGDEIMWLTEAGFLTLSYQSTSYLTHRVPELGFVDLPFLFPDLAAARAAFDGALGQHLIERVEAQYNFRVLGFFENGFRHISNRLRPIHRPEDLAGMKIRMLPSDIHERTFKLFGADPIQMDLTEAIAGVKDGSLDAQENPLANTATYGVHNYHPYHTLSGHFYLSRGIWSHRDTVDAWPDDLRAAMAAIIPEAVAYQRGLAVEEEDVSRQTIEAAGCEIVELTEEEHAAFVAKVAPLHDEARGIFGDAMFEML